MVAWKSRSLLIRHTKCSITTLLTIIIFFQIYLMFQNYHASQYLETHYFQGLADEKSLVNHLPKDLCEPKNHKLFPLCEDKFEYLSAAHSLDCFKNVHGIDGSKCSIMRYLREIEPFCFNYKRRKHHIDHVEKLTMRDDLEGLIELLSLTDFGWIRARAKHIWPDVLKSSKMFKDNQHFSNGRKKKLLFYLGSMGYQPKILKLAGHGGFVGELVQWTDIITTSYVLGHDIKIALTNDDVKYLLLAEKNKCASKFIPRDMDFDVVFADVNGNIMLHNYLQGNYARIRCKLRILDSFGTEAEFNYGRYDQTIPGGRSVWGNADLLLPQFFTYFPHSPDNTFLGFIAGKIDENEVYEKRDIAVIYGKRDFYLQGTTGFLDIIKDHFEIHATMATSGQVSIPSYIINHGVLSEVELKELLRKAKLFIGLGFPFEGPGPLDAIANGAVFLNPSYKTPKNKFNEPFFKSKPTLRKLTSQNPYMEDFVGKPYVYTVDINDANQLTAALREIKAAKNFKPFLPREVTAIGMLEKLHAFIQHQDFCDPDAPRWPPLRNLDVYLAPLGVSCKTVCRSKGRICEPTFFSDINNVETFESVGIKCRNAVVENKLNYPTYHPRNGTCYLQKNVFYFSCVAEDSKSHRLCPCRNFMQGQTALCVGCL